MAITVVQAVSATPTYQTATTSVSFGSNTTAGNCLVVAIGLGNSGATNETVTGVTFNGSAGNFALAFSSGSSASGRVEFWADPNCAGGATGPIAVTISTTTGSIVNYTAYEISGLATSSVVDTGAQVGAAWTTGTSWSSGATGTTAQASEIAVGIAVGYSTATKTLTGPSSPWVNQTQSQIQFTSGNWQTAVSGTDILSSTGTATYSGTSSVTNGGAGRVGVITLKAVGAPTITNGGTLTAGTTGVVYPGYTMTATGGTTPYTWSISVGSLPAGLSINSSTGAITGTPQTAGTSSFTVKVTDAASLTGTASCSITISSNLTVTTSGAMPGGTTGVAYSQSVSASGGFGAYTWQTTVVTGALPTGLTISAAGVISGTPTVPGTFTFTVKVTDAGTNTATSSSISITITGSVAGIPNLAVVQQIPFHDTTGYGPTPQTFSNTEGNGLVAFIAVGSDNVSGFCPRAMISDDAHNWWTLAGSNVSNTAGAARRLDIWVCENAKAATAFSVTASQVYSGLAGVLVEVQNLPNFTSIDFLGVDGNLNLSTSTITSSATQYDFVFGAAALFGSNAAQTMTQPAAFTAGLGSTSTGLTAVDMADVRLYPNFVLSATAAGAVNLTWSWTHAADYMTVAFGLKCGPPVPSQASSDFPLLITEAAFGFSPGDQTGTNPTWTDLTSRSTGETGTALFHSARGREYELTQPEAGELDITFDNLDGALTATTTGSPYFPNVLPEVPVRASMYWAGRRFGLGFSYANTWPPSFPHPQWGEIPYQGKDAIGIISQGSMPTAYAGEVLADNPTSYYILGEFYEQPHGGLFANSARYNQIPMVGFGNAYSASFHPDYELATGATVGMLGDSSSGIGVSGIVAADLIVSGSVGAFVRDFTLPQTVGAPGNSSGSSAYEFWTTGVDAGNTGNGKSLRLLSMLGLPTNFYNPANSPAAGETLGIYASAVSGGNVTWAVRLTDHTYTTYLNASGTTAQAALYHVLLNVTDNGTGTIGVQLFINNVSVINTSATSVQGKTTNILAIGPVCPLGGMTFSNNWTAGQVAVYPTQLPLNRIASHFNVGTFARQNQAGDLIHQRVQALYAWSGIGVPFGVGGVDIGNLNPLMGNADQISGSALADTLYSTAVEEGGMFYAAATANGEVWYAPRFSMYNKTPKLTLGDNPTEVSNTNPGFRSLSGWTLNGLSGTDSTDSTAQGSHSGTFTVNASGLTTASATYRTAVTPGATYMLTGCMEPVSGNATGWYGTISWYTSSNTLISSTGSAGGYQPSGQWSFVNTGTWAAPVTAPVNAAYALFGPAISVGSGTLNTGTQFKAAQFWLTCVSSEVPFDPGSGFDFSDTYIYNIVSSQLTVSSGQAYYINSAGQVTQQQFSSYGPNAITADQPSEIQYFPRGPYQQPIETASYQDAYDRANWALAQYKQPMLRANQVRISIIGQDGANPSLLSGVARLEQGDVITVTRRPLGTQAISLSCVIQKIEIHGGPNVLDFVLTLSPYWPSAGVLRADDPTYGTLGTVTLPW